MPINVSLMKALKKRYGSQKGEDVYFGMENEGKPAFEKGLRTAKKEGHTVKNLKAYEEKRGKAFREAQAESKAITEIRKEMARRLRRK